MLLASPPDPGRARGVVFALLFLWAACGASGNGSDGSATPGTPAPPPAPAPGPVAPPPTPPPPSPSQPAPVVGYAVVDEYPHDRGAYTQGLFFYGGVFYESTGLRGESSLRRVAVETGEVLAERRLFPDLFGEGAALVGDRIYQLTWTAGVGFVYDRESFRLLREFRYAGEGWGLTFDGERLVMSDGSDALRFWDPETLRETGRLPVHDAGVPVDNLNELEWIDGVIWANIWTEDRVARIDPETGAVLSWVNLEGLLPAEARRADTDVLNGIAWDPDGERLFVTGKKWPLLFQIEVEDGGAGRN